MKRIKNLSLSMHLCLVRHQCDCVFGVGEYLGGRGYDVEGQVQRQLVWLALSRGEQEGERNRAKAQSTGE